MLPWEHEKWEPPVVGPHNSLGGSMTPHTPECNHFFTSCFMILDMSSVPKKVPAEIFLSHRVRFRICST